MCATERQARIDAFPALEKNPESCRLVVVSRGVHPSTSTARRPFARFMATAALALLSLAAAPAHARDPWSDPDPPSDGTRWTMGDFGFRAGAEYRAQFLYINPISLNSEADRATSWLEHRLRLDAAVDYLDKVKVVFSTDVLDGVLWGDNGDFGGTPSSNSGTNVGTKNPNVTRPCVGLTGPDPLDANSYSYTVCPQDPLKVRKAYGEVALPFGILRIGRQPVNIGTGVQASDGDGRANRFGVARTGSVVDRILFATKPLEAFKPKGERSTSANEGLILALAYDRLVTDNPENLGQSVNQWDTALRYLAPRHAFGTDLLLSVYHAYRWDAKYKTQINSVGGRFTSRFLHNHLHVGLDVGANLGTTREVSEAFKFISHDDAVDQAVQQLGARAVVRWDERFGSLYLEADYASGDADPIVRTPLTQFTFSEDTNVGLLLFKHIVGFQSARSAAAAVETLRQLGATTFPAESVATRGAFTNAFAIFPQFDLHPHKTLLLRGGVLMAWAPAKVIDPVASLQRRDGATIQDDLVNFVGGKPASYYGTELDGRVQWRYLDHFLLDLEAAVLFPGAALQNENGVAVRSGLVQTRTTFFF
jgi:hypothetical protein